MSNLPPEIKSKIEVAADAYPCYDETMRAELRTFATFGYSLAEGEINRLKELVKSQFIHNIVAVFIDADVTNLKPLINEMWQQFKTENNL